MALTNTIPTHDSATAPEAAVTTDTTPRTRRTAAKRQTKATGKPPVAKIAAGSPKGADTNTSEQKKSPATETKASIVLKKLKSAKGAPIEALMEATGWQAHSVRGFLSAVVKKKLGLDLVSETGKDGVRRYRIQDDGKAG